MRSTKNPKQKEKDGQQEKSDDPLADRPEWLEELDENMVDTELPAPAHSSQDSDLDHPTKVATKMKEAQYSCSVPKRPELRRLLENQNDKGS